MENIYNSFFFNKNKIYKVHNRLFFTKKRKEKFQRNKIIQSEIQNECLNNIFLSKSYNDFLDKYDKIISSPNIFLFKFYVLNFLDTIEEEKLIKNNVLHFTLHYFKNIELKDDNLSFFIDIMDILIRKVKLWKYEYKEELVLFLFDLSIRDCNSYAISLHKAIIFLKSFILTCIDVEDEFKLIKSLLECCFKGETKEIKKSFLLFYDNICNFVNHKRVDGISFHLKTLVFLMLCLVEILKDSIILKDDGDVLGDDEIIWQEKYLSEILGKSLRTLKEKKNLNDIIIIIIKEIIEIIENKKKIFDEFNLEQEVDDKKIFDVFDLEEKEDNLFNFLKFDDDLTLNLQTLKEQNENLRKNLEMLNKENDKMMITFDSKYPTFFYHFKCITQCLYDYLDIKKKGLHFDKHLSEIFENLMKEQIVIDFLDNCEDSIEIIKDFKKDLKRFYSMVKQVKIIEIN